MTIRKLMSWAALGGTVAALAMTITAAPAAAHVGVTADKAQPGATDVTVSFSVAAESETAGIASLRVGLPAGIAPADIALLSGPTGWTLTPEADGYTVTGPALPARQNTQYQVKIAKLPTDATSLAFKTLQTYTDGRIDRWIELPQGGSEPEKPAPILALAVAGAPATTPAATHPAGHTAASAPAVAESGSPVWLWLVIGAVVVIAVVGFGVWFQRRRT